MAGGCLDASLSLFAAADGPRVRTTDALLSRAQVSWKKKHTQCPIGLGHKAQLEQTTSLPRERDPSDAEVASMSAGHSTRRASVGAHHKR
jgi:hypothetical protein